MGNKRWNLILSWIQKQGHVFHQKTSQWRKYKECLAIVIAVVEPDNKVQLRDKKELSVSLSCWSGVHAPRLDIPTLRGCFGCRAQNLQERQLWNALEGCWREKWPTVLIVLAWTSGLSSCRKHSGKLFGKLSVRLRWVLEISNAGHLIYTDCHPGYCENLCSGLGVVAHSCNSSFERMRWES